MFTALVLSNSGKPGAETTINRIVIIPFSVHNPLFGIFNQFLQPALKWFRLFLFDLHGIDLYPPVKGREFLKMVPDLGGCSA
jgi:hypothetical protein